MIDSCYFSFETIVTITAYYIHITYRSLYSFPRIAVTKYHQLGG